MAEQFDYKKLTLAEMMDYISDNAPEDKAWFKSIALNEEGKYQHLVAKREFCKRYMPEIIPVPKPKKSDILADW